MLNFLPPTKAPPLYNHISHHDYWTSRSLQLPCDPDVPIHVEQKSFEFKPPHATRKAGSETCNVDTGNTARSDSAYLNRSVVNYAPTHPSLSAPPSGFGSHKPRIVNRGGGGSHLKRPADGSPLRGGRSPRERFKHNAILDLKPFSFTPEIAIEGISGFQTADLSPTDSPKTPLSPVSSKADLLPFDNNVTQQPLDSTGSVLTPDLQEIVDEALALYESLRGIECLSSCSEVSKPSD